MQKLLAEQQKQTHEYAARLDESEKKYEEMSMKISTLLQVCGCYLNFFCTKDLKLNWYYMVQICYDFQTVYYMQIDLRFYTKTQVK